MQSPDQPVPAEPREPHRRGPHRIAARVADGQDARSRIQEVALELFIEQGYERTSLREIADRLGVSKAALYYHFPTKEAIVDSIAADRLAKFDELVAWLRDRPKTLATRRELVERYAAFLQQSRHSQLMRFFERNQSAMKSLSSGKQVRQRMLDMVGLLSAPEASFRERLRHSIALMALHAVWFVVPDEQASEEERRCAGLELALELMDCPAHGPGPHPSEPPATSAG